MDNIIENGLLKAIDTINKRLAKLERDQLIGKFRNNVTYHQDIQCEYPKVIKEFNTLICLDKRKEKNFNWKDIEGIQTYSCVLLYNEPEGKYFVLKNRNGEDKIEFPKDLLCKFLNNPNGKLKYDWN